MPAEERALRAVHDFAGTALACLLALTLILTLAAESRADPDATLDRPVVVAGRSLAHLLGERIGDLRLVIWRGGVWRPIPYQIDPRLRIERGAGSARLVYLLVRPGSADPAPSRRLSTDDELVFMARDAGDSPPAASHPEGALRGVTLHVPGGGFASLFSFADSPAPAPNRYVAYSAARDRIEARSYTLGFSRAHPVVFDLFRIHPSREMRPDGARGGHRVQTPNLVDGAKIRIRGKLLHVWPFQRDERNFESTVEGIREGPVRLIRGCMHRLPLAIGMKSPKVSEQQVFYPDGFTFPVWLAKSAAMNRFVTKLAVRSGPDWSEAAIGMSVMVAGNEAPVRVDGRMDPSEHSLRTQGAAWSVLYGDAGAILSRISLRPGAGEMPDIAFNLYYRDDIRAEDAPERIPGQIGALGYEFPKLEELPPGDYEWIIRTEILSRFEPGETQRVLKFLDAPAAVEINPVILSGAGTETESGEPQ